MLDLLCDAREVDVTSNMTVFSVTGCLLIQITDVTYAARDQQEFMFRVLGLFFLR